MRLSHWRSFFLSFFCNPKSGRFVLLCDYDFSSNVVRLLLMLLLLPSLLLWVFSIFFLTIFISNTAAAALSIHEQTHKYNTCLRLWYACDHFTVYVHMKELQSISSHQMNIISAGCVCVWVGRSKCIYPQLCYGIFCYAWYLLLPFLFVVEIVFHYLSVNAEVNENENEFFALGWFDSPSVVECGYENDERFIIGSKLITNAPQRIGWMALFTFYCCCCPCDHFWLISPFRILIARVKSSLILAFYELKS